jgi:hypothetical protein
VTFEEILDQALAMLQRRGRVTYRTFKRQFGLDDAGLEDLKAEFLFAHSHVVAEETHGLVWMGQSQAKGHNVPGETEIESRFQALALAVSGLLQGKSG